MPKGGGPRWVPRPGWDVLRAFNGAQGRKRPHHIVPQNDMRHVAITLRNVYWGSKCGFLGLLGATI